MLYSLLPAAVLLMGAVAYCLLLFSSSQHGQSAVAQSCATPLSCREGLAILNHTLPVILVVPSFYFIIYIYISLSDFN
jgi:hypothetical protein